MGESPGIGRYHQARVLIDISESTTVSTAVAINGYKVVAVALPAALTGTALAFQIDPGDGTYRSVETYEGTELSITVAASKVVLVGAEKNDQPYLVGANIKVVSGSAEAADRIIWLLCVPL